VVGMRSMPGNPYDGHTVDSQIEQVEILTGHTPKIVLADRGHRGVDPACGRQADCWGGTGSRARMLMRCYAVQATTRA